MRGSKTHRVVITLTVDRPISARLARDIVHSAVDRTTVHGDLRTTWHDGSYTTGRYSHGTIRVSRSAPKVQP